jgi:hypothetical protein
MSILLMATGIAIAQPSTAAVIVPSGIIFDGSPGVNAPPSSLGPYAMAGFGTDPQPLGTDVAGVDDASTGADIGFSPSLVHLRVAQGWATWSNDYTGDLYATYPATSTTISLPPGTNGFYFYAEPDLFSTFTVTATAQNGTSSGPISVQGNAGASYFGFYTNGYISLTSISIASSADFAIGEFGIANRFAPALTGYAALGDSFASGEGNPPYDAGSDTSSDSCHRSTVAYAHQVAQALDLPLSFYACSGAKTDHVLTSRLDNELFELDHPDSINGTTALATVTVGGDNIGFSHILISCIVLDLEFEAAASALGILNPLNPFSSPSCVDNPNDPTFQSDVTDAILNLQDANTSCTDPTTNALCDTFQSIADKAPNASVIATDYPEIFPSDLATQECPGLAQILTPDDMNFFNVATDLLDAQEAVAASRAGVNFVSVKRAFVGHTVCSAGEWFNDPVSLLIDILNPFSQAFSQFSSLGGSFHPNKQGQSAYAATIESFIRSAISSGAPLTAAGLPADPPPVSTGGGGGGGGGVPDPTTDYGALNILPLSAQFNASCEDAFQAGQQVEVQGDGYEPGALVTITLASPGSASAEDGFADVLGTITADSTGSIDTDVTIPPSATGFSISSGAANAVFFDATGATSDPNAETEDNNGMTALISPSNPCALPPTAAATISLSGNDTPFLPITGSVFELTGPNLPAPNLTPPAPGTFAELDGTSGGTMTCPATEPTGVSCANGAIQDLFTTAPYTVTEVQTPEGYATPSPQTFTSGASGSTTVVDVSDTAIVAAATISLSGNDTPFLPITGSVFELTGPNLPAPNLTPPAPGTFAELDGTSGGTMTCPATEPTGVSCANGAIQDLFTTAPYTVTEVQTPEGYATPSPQTFTSGASGSTTVVDVSDTAIVGNYTTGSGAQNCTLCVLSPTGDALSATGSSAFAWSGSATVDSTSSSATTGTGSAVFSGGSFFGPGGVSLVGSAALKTSVPPASGTVSDPFSWFTYPSGSGSSSSLSVSGSSTETASPGVYSTISVSGSGRLTLSPGVYIVTGSLSVSGSGKVTGTGVTIDLECSSFPSPCASGGAGLNLSGSGGLDITGGAIGPGDGFALLADHADANSILATGTSRLLLVGNVYIPDMALQVTGSSAVAVNTGELVVDEASATGAASVKITDG